MGVRMALNRIRKRDRGTTLVEMIVSFALLAVFLATAAAFITSVSSMYFGVKSENYSKQVSDIVLEKISSEISGAGYVPGATLGNPFIVDEDGAESDTGIGKAVDLFDRTDTHVSIYAEDGELVVHYYGIVRGTDDSHPATDWKFQEGIYNEFYVDDLTFVRGDVIDSFADKGDYGLTSSGSYGPDVIVVFLKLKSVKYGEYYTYRFVRMYNVKG